MTTQILEPGQIEAAAGDIPELRLPEARVFSDRARRLRQLAEGHSLGEYLRFVAHLAAAQQGLGLGLQPGVVGRADAGKGGAGGLRRPCRHFIRQVASDGEPDRMPRPAR